MSDLGAAFALAVKTLEDAIISLEFWQESEGFTEEGLDYFRGVLDSLKSRP